MLSFVQMEEPLNINIHASLTVVLGVVADEHNHLTIPAPIERIDGSCTSGDKPRHIPGGYRRGCVAFGEILCSPVVKTDMCVLCASQVCSQQCSRANVSFSASTSVHEVGVWTLLTHLLEIRAGLGFASMVPVMPPNYCQAS